MRKESHSTLSSSLSAALLVLATAVPFAGVAAAQPAPPMPGDLHVRIVTEARPPLRHEVVIARPGPNHVWVKGYWHHNGSQWAWNEGAWVAPPRPHDRWVAARYQRVHGGTRYLPGHWSHEKIIYEN